MSLYSKIALILASIGAINLGLTAVGWNAIESLIGSWAGTSVDMVIYIIIGLCGIYSVFKAFI